MNLTNVWMNLFGTTQWFDIDMGFWAAMVICLLIVVVMNAVFWGMKPKRNVTDTAAEKQG